MSELGLSSYFAGAVAFAILTVLLLVRWRDRTHGWLLVLASGISVLWNAALAWQAWSVPFAAGTLLVAEAVHAGVWFEFLLQVVAGQRDGVVPRPLRIGVHMLWLTAAAAGLAQLQTPGLAAVAVEGNVAIGAGLALALAGLVLVEQVYRNADESARWALKFLCLGAGGLFVYNFYLYTDAMLFRRVDAELWYARGAINALVVPLIAVAAARSANWRSTLAVSRRLAFFTTALTATGLYLVAMALGGYYIRVYGGNWGNIVQAVFLFGAALVLLVVLFSGQARAWLKVLVSKHLYSYKYDYRHEWLRLIRTLSGGEGTAPLPARAIQAIARLVESPIGGLWLRREELFVPCAGDLASAQVPTEPANSPFTQYIAEREWIVDLNAQRRGAGVAGLQVPAWLLEMRRAWLVVPLLKQSSLVGFIVLAEPRARQKLTWEDLDLLKTIGRQVAVDLAQHEAARLLAQAEQFEAYHRFAAFLMHDLKNVVAQLSLIVSNAARFKHREEFVDDAVATVDNAVQRISRLLEQLRRGELAEEVPRRADLVGICREAAARSSRHEPAPLVEAGSEPIWVWAGADRLTHVIEHVVRNAQEATPRDGFVRISVMAVDEQARLVVEDNGTGMDASFVRERLFRPFDTTKGSRGMGIGAYEARECIRRLGGDVAVESEPGRGTRFIMTMPLSGDGPDQQRHGRDHGLIDRHGHQEAVNR